MNPLRYLRLHLLAVFLAAVLLVYIGVLYNIQVVHHEDYLSQSVRSIAREEKVTASRGIITDRNGRPLVSNRSTYSLTFDSSLLRDGEDENAAILRLIELCQAHGVVWTDNLPITRSAPFTYTLDQSSALQKKRFLTYLRSLPEVRRMVGDYLLEHPELTGAEPPAILSQSERSDEDKRAALLETLTADTLSASLLEASGVTPSELLKQMRQRMALSDHLSLAKCRLILGVQYELSLRKLANYDAYVLADDIDTTFISLLSDGNYSGAKVSRSFVREYQTTYAAHILGTVGRLLAQDWEELKDKGYGMDDWLGRDGAELAFEQYLKGTDGRRIVSTNSDGKITGEYYSKEPVPGSTVELTLDLELQKVVEDTLAATVQRIGEKDPDPTRGAAAVVEKVGSGEILAIASYPTFDLSTYRQDYNQLSDAELHPDTPLVNRATWGIYPPGSTLKPLTAVAALESGVTTTREKIFDTGRWSYPNSPQSYTYCWNRGGHGSLNVSQSITNSCNYFFAEMGYRMGMDTFRDYLSAFGFGSSTGIEIGDYRGILPENPPGQDQAPWAAYGQANQVYTPIQLANYVATLVGGGKHYPAHLLKTVKSYDNSSVIATGTTEPLNIVSISDSTLNAVKTGMLGYTTPGGSVASYFADCIVSAGAKTGTAQLGGNTINNGVFVCFAPYEEPEIAVAIAIEHSTAGANLASTAVSILNAYFSQDEIGAVIVGEQELLP